MALKRWPRRVRRWLHRSAKFGRPPRVRPQRRRKCADAEKGMSTIGSASSAMGRVGTTANQASQKVTALNEASEAIRTIVSSIDAIAKQTTFLR
jgi:hypothetical protein